MLEFIAGFVTTSIIALAFPQVRAAIRHTFSNPIDWDAFDAALEEIDLHDGHGDYPEVIVRFSLEDEYDDNPLSAMGRAAVKANRPVFRA